MKNWIEQSPRSFSIGLQATNLSDQRISLILVDWCIKKTDDQQLVDVCDSCVGERGKG